MAEQNKTPGSTVLRGLLAAVCAGVLLASAGAQAEVASVDRYGIVARLTSPGRVTITGAPGSLPVTSKLLVVNVRTWETTTPSFPEIDGSFSVQIGALRGDRLSLIVEDPSGANSRPTVVVAGGLVIKNPYRPGGYWWVGQGHAHTTNSDGVDAPANLEAAYALAGYDFVISTDHRGWPYPSFMGEDDGMTPDPFNGGVLDLLWIRGSEIGNYSVHLGSWGTTSRVPLGSIYYTQQAIDATRALGGIAVINHPENVDPPKSWDWSEEIVPVRDVSLVEAFNGKHLLEGGGANHIADAIDLADEFRQVWWIGTDDCHAVNDPEQFNRYAIVVQTDSPAINQPDILAAIDSGSHYIRQTAQGPKIDSVSVDGNTVRLVLQDVDSAYEVAWYRRGGELLDRNTDVDRDAAYTVRGFEGYVRAEVTRLSDGSKAYTQPLFVANGEDISASASSPALTDNRAGTVWDAGAATGSFVIDAGRVRNINAVRIEWDSSGGARFNYAIEASETGEFSGEQLPAVRATLSNRAALTLDFFDVRARYIRVVITGQSAGTAAAARVREVELFESTPSRSNFFIDNVNGDDANSGFAGAPWRTFDFARERMRPRDTLNFIQNSQPYPGRLQLHSRHSGKHAGATVAYQGASGTLARIDATGVDYGVVLTDTNFVEWRNFDISRALNAGLFVSGGESNVIERNRLHDSAGRGVLGAGDFTLAYNLIYGNGSDGVMLYRDGTSARVFNNVMYGNGAGGLTIQNTGALNAVVQNNIVDGNGGHGLWRSTNAVVTDSHNCGTGPYVGPWSQTAYVFAEPQFAAPAAADFRLQLTSACIDAGIDLGYNADYAGEPVRDVISRPDTGSPGQYGRRYVDIGAHEACDTCNSGGGCHR